MDECATFAEKMGAWCGPDGKPRSWHHFVYGAAYLQREEIRATLRDASSVRLGSTHDGNKYASLRRELKMLVD